jgi:hypothetical protein
VAESSADALTTSTAPIGVGPSSWPSSSRRNYDADPVLKSRVTVLASLRSKPTRSAVPVWRGLN